MPVGWDQSWRGWQLGNYLEERLGSCPESEKAKSVQVVKNMGQNYTGVLSCRITGIHLNLQVNLFTEIYNKGTLFQAPWPHLGDARHDLQWYTHSGTKLLMLHISRSYRSRGAFIIGCLIRGNDIFQRRGLK